MVEQGSLLSGHMVGGMGYQDRGHGKGVRKEGSTLRSPLGGGSPGPALLPRLKPGVRLGKQPVVTLLAAQELGWAGRGGWAF